MVGSDRSTVLRSRLLGRLAHRCDRPVTLVIAGAGFGKTTLVRQMLADPKPVAACSDIVVPLRRPAPDAAGLVQLLLGSVGAVGTPGESGLDRLVDATWARSPEHVVLVIDDVHLLDEAAGDVLAQLGEQLPQNGHLVLVGRRAPFEPPPRALLDGSVELIGEHDLAFDDDELTAFERLRSSDSEAPTSPTSSRWPALLELERAVGRSGVIDYLVDELLGALDPEVLAAARRTAVHSPVDADMIEAVVDEFADASGEVGEVGDVEPGRRPTTLDLRAALPMTTSTDDQAVVVHDLVRAALVSGLDADERQRAQRRIAAVLAARGEHRSAIRLFDEVGDLEAIERIARTVVDDLYMRDATERSRQLLEALRCPLGQHLVLDVLDGVLTLLDHPERARPMLERAAERASEVDDSALEALCVLRLADDAYCAADHVALDRHAQRLHELADGGSSSARRIAFAADIWALSLAGRHDEVVELVDGLLSRGGDHGAALDAEVRDFAQFNWVIHRAYSGHIVDALAAAEAVRQMPEGLYANRLAGFELIQRWELGQLSAAERAAAVQLVDRIESMGQVALFVEGAATTALFHASAGDVTTAAELVERAEREVPRLPATAWPVHTVAQGRAVLQVMAGDEEAAAATLRAAMPEGGVAGLPRFIYGATGALSYLLVPETREVWDNEPCGPDHLIRRHVAHALVALRERQDPTPAVALPWGDLARIRTWAYEPHLAELAVAAVESGAREAAAVFDDLRHDPRRHLSAIVDSGNPATSARARDVLRSAPRRPRDVARLTVLGPMTLRRADVVVGDDVWTRRQRVRDLLGLLVHHRTVNRSTLSAWMWPDKSADAAAGNLRYTLNQLLGVLEPERDASGPSWFVRSSGQQLTLVADELLVVDVDEFRLHVAAAKAEDRSGNPGRALEQYRAAIGLYGGPYLADVSDDEWGYLERLNLQGELVEAVSRSVDLLIAAREVDEAERLAAKAVELEPLNEPAVDALARVLLERGRVGAARDVVAHLLAELSAVGLEPESTTADLAARLGIACPGVTRS